MSVNWQKAGARLATFIPASIARHKIPVLLVLVIAVALTLVGVSMTLYSIDGTAQLDLSRPGYRGVATRIDQEVRTFEEYPASGPIDEAALDEFEALFNKQVDRVTGVDAFSGDPLDPEALRLDEDASVDVPVDLQP